MTVVTGLVIAADTSTEPEIIKIISGKAKSDRLPIDLLHQQEMILYVHKHAQDTSVFSDSLY